MRLPLPHRVADRDRLARHHGGVRQGGLKGCIGGEDEGGRLRARSLMEEAKRFGANHPDIPRYNPMFVEGDLALLERQGASAAHLYGSYREEAGRWLGDGADLVVAMREASAVASRRRPIAAWRIWLEGFEVARRWRADADSGERAVLIGWWAGLPAAAGANSFVHVLQYSATVPGLLVSPVWPSGARWWLFLLRNLANRFVYPGLERLHSLRHRTARGVAPFQIE